MDAKVALLWKGGTLWYQNAKQDQLVKTLNNLFVQKEVPQFL